jgi:hypothetical protein
LKQSRVGALFDLSGESSVIGGLRILSSAQPKALKLEEVAQGFQALGRWTLMNPIETLTLAANEKVGCASISHQHALFNEAVGVIAMSGLNAGNAALLIGSNERLDRLKLNCTSRLALGQKRTKYRVKGFEHHEP